MRFILGLIIATLIQAPIQPILASQGAVDQYGGHECLADCESWGLTNGQYHYHDLAIKPSYFSGEMVKPSAILTFYMPEIVKASVLVKPASLINSALIENPALDVSYCRNHGIFAPGKYDNSGKVRVAPVCVDEQSIVMTDRNITAQKQYRELPIAVGGEITKVYNFETHGDGKVVYTNRPEPKELVGQIVQGETDSKMYTVIANDLEMGLREIDAGYAKMLAASENYQQSIAYFDDSVVYSYKVGSKL